MIWAFTSLGGIAARVRTAVDMIRYRLVTDPRVRPPWLWPV